MILWELLEKTTSQFEDYKIGEAEDLENVAIWNEDAISDEDKRQKVSTFILFNKVLCSDQFASVSDPNFIKQMLEKYKQLAQNSEDEKYEKYVSKQVEKINKELDTFEDNHLSSLLPSSQSK